MHKSKSERLVTLAIRAGCKNGADIAKETGLNIGTVYQQIGLLEPEHGVTDLVALRAALNPPSPDDVRAKYPEFTSHDCVILDKQLPPHIAASLILQVLGEAYSAEFATALSNLSLQSV